MPQAAQTVGAIATSFSEAAGAPLRGLAHEDAATDAARREWSVEMRSQLSGLRELCAVSASQPSLGQSLLGEISRSLATQSDRLAVTASVLERELPVAALAQELV